MFCPKCKSLLFPSEGKLVCRRCGTEVEQGAKKQIISHMSKEKVTPVMEEVSGTLPTAVMECPVCGNKKAYWVLRQTRAADEPETRIFRCTKCSHSWREY